MKNLSKDKKEKIILIVMTTLVLVVGAWYGVINAQNARLTKNRATIAEEKSKVDNGKRLLGSTSELEADLATASKELDQIEQGMASGDMYSWIILKVNKFKRGYKIDIPQFSREVTGEVNILPRFPYRSATFTVKGTAFFHEFGRFLADFENEFPYLRVQNISLQPGPVSASAGMAPPTEEISFRMELVALINPGN